MRLVLRVSSAILVSFSLMEIYSNFTIYEKGGLVRPMRQLIKLTWPKCSKCMIKIL